MRSPYKLPNDQWTDDGTEYVRQWEKHGLRVAKAMGAELSAFDPSYRFHDSKVPHTRDYNYYDMPPGSVRRLSIFLALSPVYWLYVFYLFVLDYMKDVVFALYLRPQFLSNGLLVDKLEDLVNGTVVLDVSFDWDYFDRYNSKEKQLRAFMYQNRCIRRAEKFFDCRVEQSVDGWF